MDGDRIMAVSAHDLKKRGKLGKNTLIATIMSNIGLDYYLKKKGIKLIRTQVGDRYVMEEMIRRGCNLGGEQSGHIIFRDYNTTGDGAITALQVLAIMCKSGKPLSRLVSGIVIYPQVLVNVKVPKPKKIERYPSLVAAIRKAQKSLGNGRILVRPSGTEPKIRVMVEGDDMSMIEDIAGGIAEVIKRTMK